MTPLRSQRKRQELRNEGIAQVARQLRDPLATFHDVVLTHSTAVRLHELLVGAFPACRSNHTHAALKAHVVLRVCGEGDQRIQVTAERVHDGSIFQVNKWVKDRLLLFDLRYFRYQLFARITRNGGWLLLRLKEHPNPTLVAVDRRHRGRAVGLVGAKLRDVLQRLQREVLEVMVEVRFENRRYVGRTRRATQRLRVVSNRDAQSDEYHLYVTNIPSEKLAAEEVSAAYVVRWQIELLFKEIKRHHRLENKPSAKRAEVEALLCSTILTFMVVRTLEALVCGSLDTLGERVPH